MWVYFFMSEQLTRTPNPEVSENNKRNYSIYKSKVYTAEWRKAWLNDKSVKGVLKRAISEAGDTVLGQGGMNKERNARMLGAPDKQLERNAEYFKQNEEAVKLDAIHDFNNDPANAGKELNLPESGLPETATNVQPLPAQAQKNSLSAHQLT
jgi:hypothetical protein